MKMRPIMKTAAYRELEKKTGEAMIIKAIDSHFSYHETLTF